MTSEPFDASAVMARRLRFVLALAQFKDLAFAARRLHVSQIVLRLELRAIEAAFGVRFFDGTGHGAKLVVEAIDALLQQLGVQQRNDAPPISTAQAPDISERAFAQRGSGVHRAYATSGTSAEPNATPNSVRKLPSATR